MFFATLMGINDALRRMVYDALHAQHWAVCGCIARTGRWYPPAIGCPDDTRRASQ